MTCRQRRLAAFHWCFAAAGRSILEVPRDKSRVKSLTDASRCWWHLYGSRPEKPSIFPRVAFWVGAAQQLSLVQSRGEVHVSRTLIPHSSGPTLAT